MRTALSKLWAWILRGVFKLHPARRLDITVNRYLGGARQWYYVRGWSRDVFVCGSNFMAQDVFDETRLGRTQYDVVNWEVRDDRNSLPDKG